MRGGAARLGQRLENLTYKKETLAGMGFSKKTKKPFFKIAFKTRFL
jgi:hypothetical protein